jgi:hypothetical protein
MLPCTCLPMLGGMSLHVLALGFTVRPIASCGDRTMGDSDFAGVMAGLGILVLFALFWAIGNPELAAKVWSVIKALF